MISKIEIVFFENWYLRLMNSNKTKKNITAEFQEKLKKSKFDVLTNENDFLVKNLKKAG